MSFEQSRELARKIADGNKSTLDAFRLACSDLFQIQVERKEQPFIRKPPIGLRFRLGPNVLAICSPRFDYGSKTVLCRSQTIELIKQEQTERKGEQFFRPVKRLGISLSDKGNHMTRWYRNTLADDALQLLTGIERFLQHPNQQMEGMSHCAVCGRVLSDGQSRARGVGPECIEMVSRWPFYTNKSVFGSQAPVQLELPLETE